MVGWLRKLRRPVPRVGPIRPSAQAKMARALTTLITSGGMQELRQARQMAKTLQVKRSHIAAVLTPPEEDFARENLLGVL